MAYVEGRHIYGDDELIIASGGLESDKFFGPDIDSNGNYTGTNRAPGDTDSCSFCALVGAGSIGLMCYGLVKGNRSFVIFGAAGLFARLALHAFYG